MSWIKGILGGVIGAEALSLVKDYIEKKGGVENVVKEFEGAGFANKVRSWVSTGPNLQINPIEVQQALGLDKLAEIARSAGIPVDKAKDLLAEYLPTAIDKLTPEGKLPQAPAGGPAPTKGY
jgi:uncharacterized protein YidB (DUF937 family)